MSALLAERILQAIEQAHVLYHRLVLAVADSGSGKTNALHIVSRATGVPLINVNLELSRYLLELAERQRALQVRRILIDIVSTTEAELVLLDNIEVLFDPQIKQDPLRLLLSLARGRTVVASWRGAIQANHLTYATPNHPEFRRYPVRDFLTVTSTSMSGAERS